MLWQILKPSLGELLIQAMKPIAEISPLFVLLKVPKQAVYIASQVLVFPYVFFFLFLH